ncbi:MAG: HAD-IIIA family hydrolase [Verrucomicrobiota bacterium]
MKSAIFLDRDDTIIKNVPYNGDPSKVELMPTAPEALKLMKELGYALFILSNQSGVGRGYITREQVKLVNQEMLRQLKEKDVTSPFTKIYNAYACPETGTNKELSYRKPLPAYVNQARDAYQLDLSRSYFIGDRVADVMCGKNAGCSSILVLTGSYKDEKDEALENADYAAKTLLEAAQWIQKVN